MTTSRNKTPSITTWRIGAVLLASLLLAACNIGDDAPVVEGSNNTTSNNTTSSNNSTNTNHTTNNNGTTTCMEDMCGVCDDDPSNDCEQDCAGVWGGDAYEDACGVCDANPENDCAEDCAGVIGGDAVEDMCGVCDDDPSNDCEQDCAGVWGGDAVEDACGVCDADPDNDCDVDCNDVPGGDAVEDMCGVCDSDPNNDCAQDCHGDWGGTATLDSCGICVGGNTGRTSLCKSVTLTVDADAYVSASAPDARYGTEKQMLVRRNSKAEVFLRFDLGNLPKDAIVLGSKLRATAFQGFAWGGDGNVYTHFVKQDEWKEKEITYNNKPDVDTTTHLGHWNLWYDRTPSEKVGENASEALAERVRLERFGDGMISLMLRSPGYDTDYHTRESADASKHPELEVFYMIGQSVTIEPEADATVSKNSPTKNFGVDTDLIVDRQSRHVLMRFNLASVPAGAQIYDSTLSAIAHTGFAYGGDGDVYTRLVSDDTWGEKTITWDNQPMADDMTYYGYWWLWYDGISTRQEGVNSAPEFNQLVSSEFAGDKKLSIKLYSPGYRTNYRSREYSAAADRPTLRMLFLVL